MLSENGEKAQGPVALKLLDGFDRALSNRVYLSIKDAMLRLDYRPGQILRK